MSSTACTDSARLRKSRLIAAISSGPSGEWLASHAGGLIGIVLKLGGSGARSPGKSSASRGAGTNGEWGANVATSRKNGLRAAVELLMKSTALSESTSVR